MTNANLLPDVELLVRNYLAGNAAIIASAATANVKYCMVS